MSSPEELDDNMQTYEEFRSQVDGELYGARDHFESEVIFDASKIKMEVIFEIPPEPAQKITAEFV